MKQSSNVGAGGTNYAESSWRLVAAGRWLAASLWVSIPVHAGDFIFFESFETALHPVAGSVVFTEVMSNPVAVGDSAGEWFELSNVSDQTVDLGGCVVSQNAAQDTLPAHALAPGGFAVVARSTDGGTNGNVVAFASFAFSLLSSGSLNLSCDGRVIDAMTWSNESQGHSLSLYPTHFNAIDNDNTLLNWCFTAQSSYNGTDFGTPNTGNETCASG